MSKLSSDEREKLPLHTGTSRKPPGDVVTAQVTNDGVEPALKILRENLDHRSSVISTEPRSIVSASSQQRIDNEKDEASWPEMATKLRRETARADAPFRR